jgi:hypothetical protein
MAEQGHQRLQAHAGVDQHRAVGVAELVRHDPERRPVRTGESGGAHGLVEPLAAAPGPQLPAVLAEQEVGGPAVAGVRQGALGAAVGRPGVERDQGARVQRHRAFRAELAERDPQPRPGPLPAKLW